MLFRFFGLILSLLSFLFTLSACAPAPPTDAHNICHIYEQYPKWYWATEDAYHKWGIPEYVEMAVIYQESSYNAYAKPPRRHILWIIPWKRISTAKGYSQALNGTWDHYEKMTHHDASRTNFDDASDFIGWYAYLADRVDGISKYDTYDLYLAYHEGLGGYAHRSYISKPWLMTVARRVSANAATYHYQLARCEGRLPQRKSWWHFWK